MTTSATLLDGDEFEGPRWLRGPAEGWLSLVLVAIMLVATAAAIDDARWAGTIAWIPCHSERCCNSSCGVSITTRSITSDCAASRSMFGVLTQVFPYAPK